MANPNMEEHAPSLSASEDGLQGASGQADTCGKCICCNPEESTQDPFEMAFMKAWKAIEDGEISTLKQAIQEMKMSEGGSFPSLDTCRRIEGGGFVYSMSLLAFCGFHGRKDMMDLLLKNGADMNGECMVHTGTPICQLMVHCLHDSDKLSNAMLNYFIEKGAKLNGKIAVHQVGLNPEINKIKYAMLDLPLSMKRIDCAKNLVMTGLDLICGGSSECETFTVLPMFEEYHHYGTNEFISWAFKEYIPNHPEIDLKRIIRSIINMKNRDKHFCWWTSVQRAPAHAILTSQHEETIKRLIECAKDFDLNLLNEQSCTGNTALHVAAGNNDVESVHILLRLGADTTASDKSGMNPFMLAVEKDNLEVVKAMMEEDPDLVSSQVGCGSTMTHWVLKRGRHRSDLFKIWFEKAPKTLLTAKDSQGNTIAHMVAASENSEVLKMLWSKEFAEAIFCNKNLEGKTPLQLAVEKGYLKYHVPKRRRLLDNCQKNGATVLGNENVIMSQHSILETLESCIDKGTVDTTPMWHRKLKAEWWKDMVKYIMYASSNGLLRAVKYFIDKGQKPHRARHDGKTPLLCAAEAGHDEIVEYLLEFDEVQADLKNEKEKVDNASASPLLIAAQNGHTKCVTLLLQNGGDVLQRDSEDRNCLILAIQNHNKATALAILSAKDGLKALKTSLTPQPLLSDRKLSPLQLLIKEMPDLAEYVMNKCITQDGENQPVKYNFDILKDQVPQKDHDQKDHDQKDHDQKDHDQKDHDHYTLVLMIEHNRLELLQHPLVEDFFFQKFWVKTFPLFVFKLLLYFLFLVALNLFVWVIPRPGPDSETCQGEDDLQTLAATAIDGQCGDERRFLATIAITLCTLFLFGLSLVEVVQLTKRGWRYFKDPDNYFQLALYILAIIFIVSNDSWCSTHWQWQIGAFAVFLSWINFILILKYIPYTAVPINMFVSICVKFLKMIFLPLLLVLAFGIPFYMVFSTEKSESLTVFTSPSQAIAKTFVQLAGEYDFQAIFNQGTLLYSPTTYILFFTFLITVPISFNNLLNVLAAGESLDIIKTAKLTTHYFWMELILERGWMKGLYTYGDCKTVYSKSDGSSKEPRLWSENFYLGFVLAFLATVYSRIAEFLLKRFGKVYSTKTARGNSRLVEFLLRKFGKEYSIHSKIAKKLKKKTQKICSTVMAPKPVKEDDMVTPHKLLQKGSRQELPVCHDAVQTHAESTAKIAGPIHGVEIIGEVEFRVLKQEDCFVWGGYGLRIYVPKASLPPDIEECRINIKASFSGQFQLPEDSHLLSPIYWISAPCKFTKPLTVEIQHCALGEDKAALSSLSFVSAKCSQRGLPYKFRKVDGGVFTTHSSYGSIQLSHFSGLGITGKKGTLKSYCGHLYYNVKQIYESRFYFVITQDLDAMNMVVREQYGTFAKKDATLRIGFEGSEITMNIPVAGLVTRNGWRITPIAHPTISKMDADQFEPGQWIPECQLVVQWERKVQRPVPLRHKVDLKGAKEPYDFIYLILDPGTSQPNQGSIGGSVEYNQGLHSRYTAGMDSEPDLSDLINEIAAEIPSKWRDMGQQLGLDQGKIDGIALISPEDTNRCYSNLFSMWKNSNSTEHPYTWSTVVRALKTRAVGEVRLAAKIKNEVTGYPTQ